MKTDAPAAPRTATDSSLTMAELCSRYESGETDPVAVLDEELGRIAVVNPAINAVPYVATGSARQQAAAAATRWARGAPIAGGLDGMPITIKDSFRAEGMPWRHGTRPNAALPPSVADSSPVRAIRAAGGVIVAKTAMPDLGMMAAGVSSLYGIVRNPWDPATNTSGSSAGAGASLAAGVACASLGSDIAGSVRLPAASNGLVGLKPTQGLIPYLAPSSMRSPGPLARTVEDAWCLLDAVATPDIRDNRSLPSLAAPTDHQELAPQGLRIGVLTDLGYGWPVESPVLEAVARVAQLLATGGADVSDMAPLFDHDPYPALDRLFQVRAITELESYGDAAELLHPAVRNWARPARDYSAADYMRDTAAVDLAQRHVTLATAAYDFVVSPVLPVVSFPAESVGLDESHPLAHCGFTAWYNQTGQPAITLCFGLHENHPIGVQLIGPRFSDYRLLGLTSWLEHNRPFVITYPEVA